VSPKNLALIAAAVAVMIMGVYLFIQVKASPAQAQSSATPTPTHSPPVERAIEPAQPATAKPLPARPSPTPSPPPIAGNSEPQIAAAPTDEQRANPKLDSLMELANKAYDTQDFDQAIAIAGKVLAKDPTNVRMLRIMVSANCISGDAAVAQSHYDRLPKPPAVDREQMKARCDRYQVTLRD
jgi:cell division protein FtsN